MGAADISPDPVVLDWLRKRARRARRYGSVCSGAFFLAAAHPTLDHSVANLAKRMNLSARHLSRLFRSEMSTTPATWVEQVRVGAARRLLEEGRESPKQVAAHCGFSDADTFRRAFARNVGVTPAEYRKRFATGAAG
jgi:transcriptional regulator GlxA family with amidase domain